MRYLTPVLFAAVASVLSTAPAQADLGDQLFKLLADDGAAGDEFGNSIAIDNGVVAVGAFRDDDNGNDSGSAYLFDASTGAQLFKLLPCDGAANDWFGFSVAISGATAIVGAIGGDNNGFFSGSAYLFDISDPANPTQIAKLLPNDGAELDVFGWSVAISGNTAIVGADSDDDNGFDSGSAYLFDTITGDQMAKLLPDDGAADDFFGSSVAISGTTAIIGAIGDDDNGFFSGSAYLFDISDPANPTQIAKLLPNDGAMEDFFGDSVAISSATAIVGADSDDDNGIDSGSAYLFNITDPANPMEIAKLLPNDGAASDFFGGSVAIRGGIGIVGARLDDDNGTDSGSAYLFDISDPANPTQIAKLLPNDGADSDAFGWSVAISEATAIVGAPDDDDTGTDSGSAYLFSAVGGIDFDPPEEFPAFGEATVEAVGSFDAAGNDTADLVVVIPGSKRQANGNVQVFLNQGNNNKTGDWNGLEAGALIPVGNIPSDITAGFFNDDAFVDLAVSNAGDNQLSILLGDGNGSFDPGPPEGVGQAPSAVASGDFDMDGHVDLVVANALDDNVWVLFGDGMGGFIKGPMLPTGGPLPIGLDPEDLDNDKDLDIVGINHADFPSLPLNGSVFVILNNGDGSFAPAVNYPVGTDPRQLAIADVDGDTFGDVVVVNGADATVSVLLNQGDGTFAPAIEIGVGTSPRSIDAVDLDGDGDPDLVIAATDAAMEPVVQVLVNITSGIGEVEFELPLEFSVNADPNFVASADFNADTRPDIVTANADEGKTGGSVTVLLNDSPPLPEPCPWDLNADGSVGVPDLLALLADWGPCKGCPADFDGNGNVGVSDLLVLLANWGPCP